MIERINDKNKYVSKNRVSSMTFTYPVTNCLYFGNYERKDILHNLKITLKSADKKMSPLSFFIPWCIYV